MSNKSNNSAHYKGPKVAWTQPSTINPMAAEFAKFVKGLMVRAELESMEIIDNTVTGDNDRPEIFDMIMNAQRKIEHERNQ